MSSDDRTIESLTKSLLDCYEELDLIYRLSRGLMSTLDIQKNAELILGEAMEIFEADVGWIVPAGGDPPPFQPVLTGVEASVVERLGDSPVREMIAGGKSRLFYSLGQELGLAGDGVPDSLLCAAVKTETAVYGALCVGRSGPERLFTAGDLKLSGVLASQAAIAIENSLLQRKRIEEEQAMIRIQEEMRLARDIQANLLPRTIPAVSGYDIAGHGAPALSVGGDYYDFIPLNGARLALCLADVAGKGMPAALLMANIQATIRSHTFMELSPGECLRRSNRLLYQSTDAGQFATCFYGLLDTASDSLCYSNAGHDHPLLFLKDGGYTTLPTGGLMLGVADNLGYEESQVCLAPGDVLVLYSDGITEAFDGEGQEFGIEKLVATVAGARHRSARDLLDSILAAVLVHAGGEPQSDDMTLVVIKKT